jgi:hypothetical protein
MALVWSALLALLLIQVKHLLIDWIWQPPYEHQNKGTYGHFGGIRHAGKNALGTGYALFLGFLPVTTLSGWFLLTLVILDFLVHYHVDWVKMNLNRRHALCPLTHAQFWWLTGLDQFLHQVTYVALVALVLLWL